MREDSSILLLIQKFLEDELTEEEAVGLLRVLQSRELTDPRNHDLRENLWVHLLLDHLSDTDKKLIDIEEPSLFSETPDSARDMLPQDTFGWNEQLQQLETLEILFATPGKIEDPLSTCPPSATTRPVYSKQTPQKISYALYWSVGAIILMFGIGIYQEFFKSSDSKPDFVATAQIRETIEAEWEEGAETFKSGQEIEPSLLKLQSGIVKVVFADGAEVIIEGPAELLIKGRNKAFCRHGKLSVSVPPQAVGFEVSSPLATIVDLGTAFSMEVSEVNSGVHVLAGKVEVKPSVKEILQLQEGSAAILDLRGETKRVPADPTTFFSENMLQERIKNYESKRRDVWNEVRDRLENDPSLLYRLVPENVRGLDQLVGRRSSKKAVRFQTPRERLSVSVMKECDHLTLIASVRLESQKNFANTLLVGESFGSMPGEFLWQINRFGAAQFHLGGDENTPRQFDSQPVVGRRDLKTWIKIALVADAAQGTITHYFEGRPVATLPWQPIPLRLERLTLGNERPVSRKSSARFFNGSIEEFWIFARPFSAKEIRDIYENNE